MAKEITVNSMYDISMRGITNATSPTISTPLVTADIQQNITAKHNYMNGVLVNGHTITIG